MTTETEVYEALTLRVVVDDYGTRRYFNSSNLLHREAGPAVEYIDGTSLWYQNGLRHRVDGPAVVYPNSQKFWFIEDCAVSQEKFNEYVSRIAEEVSRNLAS